MKKVKKKESLTKDLLNTFLTETAVVIHSAFEDSSKTVAFVDVDESWTDEKKLETAFMLTNSIEGAWYTSNKVKYVGPGKSCRSTSVGDMIMLNNGKKFKCEHIGWSEV